ncbi:hypothetical protein GTA08_BOTSDO05304 [Neofusicoccum parvum]|uniref:Uncharacterized protein n=1 Tax=Neofusicoccum parvum TaxID=310453 RepID=A0ACB5RWY4_9PEZI|nr:hypothetical protein GTA08_BOTSDO05304 [Neofusicoccum parvum]
MDDPTPAHVNPDAPIDPNTVFQLKGIPATIHGKEPTKADAVALLTQAWPRCQDARIAICTLSTDPSSPTTLTATLNFTAARANNPPTSATTPPAVTLPPDHAPTTLTLTSTFLTPTQSTTLHALRSPRPPPFDPPPCAWLPAHPAFTTWLDGDASNVLRLRGPAGAGKTAAARRVARHLREAPVVGEERLVLTHFGADAPWRGLLAQVLPLWPERVGEAVRRGRGGGEEGAAAGFLGVLAEGAGEVGGVVVVVGGVEGMGEGGREVVRELRRLAWRGEVKVCFSERGVEGEEEGEECVVDVAEWNGDDIRRVVHGRLWCEGEECGVDHMRIEEEVVQRAAGNFQWASVVAEELAGLRRSRQTLPTLREKLATMPSDLDQLYGSMLGQIDPDKRPQALRLFRWMQSAQEPLSITELQHAMILDSDTHYTSIEEYKKDPGFVHISDMASHVKKLSRGLVAVEEYSDRPHPDTPADLRVWPIHHSVSEYLFQRGGLALLAGPDAEPSLESSLLNISRCCIRYLKMREVVEETQKRLDFAEAMLEIGNDIESGLSLENPGALAALSRKIEDVAEAWNLDLKPDHGFQDANDLPPSEASSRIQTAFSWLAATIARQTTRNFPFASHAVHSLHTHLLTVDRAGLPHPDLTSPHTWSPSTNFLDSWRHLALLLHPLHPPTPFSAPPPPPPPRSTTPLHHIARHALLSSLPPALTTAPPTHLTHRDATAHTPLTAALSSHPHAVPSLLAPLLAHPATDPATPDPAGRVPLSLAAQAGSLPAVDALLRCAAAAETLDRPDAAGRAPLSYAAEVGARGVVERLLGAGGGAVEVGRVDGAGRTAVGWAVVGGYAGVVGVLGGGVEGGVLEWAVRRGEVRLVKGALEEEEGEGGTYARVEVLRRVREMVGVVGGDEEEGDPVEEARVWLRQNLWRFEERAERKEEIWRLMAERRKKKKKKEREERLAVVASNQGPGKKINSRL